MKVPILSLLAVAALSVHAVAQAPDADNTKVNERDASGETLTPIDQSNDPNDIKITAEIRKLVVDDSTLSATAKNVKIITEQGGAVTLRGPVKTEQEKTTIEQHAKAGGASSVVNQLEVEKE